MSTYDQYQPGGPGIFGYLGLLFLLGAVVIAVLSLIGPALAPFADALDTVLAISVPEIWHDPNQDTDHAFQRHGADTLAGKKSQPSSLGTAHGIT